ncbi:hypothetical protein LZ30DRAFT_303887 [Colletotrichum cereale]|nr:hypothetical protein LZ30DRAFT_303887 [Colletotrichum cereale]
MVPSRQYLALSFLETTFPTGPGSELDPVPFLALKFPFHYESLSLQHSWSRALGTLQPCKHIKLWRIVVAIGQLPECIKSNSNGSASNPREIAAPCPTLPGRTKVDSIGGSKGGGSGIDITNSTDKIRSAAEVGSRLPITNGQVATGSLVDKGTTRHALSYAPKHDRA